MSTITKLKTTLRGSSRIEWPFLQVSALMSFLQHLPAHTQQEKEALTGWSVRLAAIGDLAPNLLKALANNSAKRAKQSQQVAARSKQQSIKQWMRESLDKGAGAAHRWAKAVPEDTPILAHTHATPLQLLEQKRKHWAGFWQRDCLGQDFMERVRALVSTAKAIAVSLSPITVDILDRAIQSLKLVSAKGLDLWVVVEWRGLTQAQKQSLADLLDSLEQAVDFPTQAAMNAIALKFKTALEDRPIGLTPMLYRLWSACRKQAIRIWGARVTGPWDDATQGSSAQKAVALRSALDESVKALKLECATLFLDLSKFYDNIQWAHLLDAALTLGYSPLPFALALNLHMAPRILKSKEGYSTPIHPTTGIVAGCAQAHLFAKMVLFGAMKELHAALFGIWARQYVDDLAIRAQGLVRHVVQHLVAAAGILQHQLQAIQQPINNKKTCFTASSNGMAEALQAGFEAIGFGAQQVAEQKDLGITTNSAGRRVRTAAKKREARARGRARKVRLLSRRFVKARKLFATGVSPQAKYGQAVMGFSPTTIAGLRAMAARSLAVPAGACTSVAIALLMGEGQDPSIKTRQEVVTTWLGVWAHEHMRPRLRLAWKRIRPNLEDARVRWLRVVGVISATIATLLDIGWDPLEPDLWSDLRGDTWQIDPSVGAHLVLDLIATDIQKAIWAKASRHYAALGLESGVDLKVVRHLLKHFASEGDWQSYAVCVAVVTGACWPLQRKFEAFLVTDPLCSRRGKCPETLLHRLWQCEANAASTHPAIASTQNLCIRALSAVEVLPCFWLRACVPKHWTQLDTAPCTQEHHVPPIAPLQQLDSSELCLYATDGSGGEFTKDARVRRVSYGMLAFSGHREGSLKVGDMFWGTLAGKQTVPRAETFAVLRVLETAPRHQPICIFTDHAGVVRTTSKPVSQWALRANADLWASIQDAYSKRTAYTEFVKVKAHSTKATLDSSVSFAGVLANAAADALATFGASKSQAPEGERDTVWAADALAKQVLERHVAIAAECVQLEQA